MTTKFSQRHYEAIAGAIASAQAATLGNRSAFAVVADNLADMLAADNPRFKRQLFLKASGVSE